MAQTKTGSATRPRSSKPRSTGSSTKRKATKKRKPSTPASSNGAQAHSARESVESTAKKAGGTIGEAGRSVGRAAVKAKTPLLASGAAVAGAAGGLALGTRAARRSKTLRRPKLKVRSQDLARAARDVGQFGMDVGQLAGELRKNREQANGSARRSPVEVVLEGLTHRGNGSSR